jgi:hypothetical protein
MFLLLGAERAVGRMNIVLKNQIYAADRSAQELEDELQNQHRGAMLSYNVQELAQSAVDIFSEINDNVERRQGDQVNSKQEEGDGLAQHANEWHDLYRRLAIVFDRTAGLVGAMEKEEYLIDGKREFLAAWRELRGIVCFSPNRVALAVEQLQRGEVRPLADIERELRDLPLFILGVGFSRLPPNAESGEDFPKID